MVKLVSHFLRVYDLLCDLRSAAATRGSIEEREAIAKEVVAARAVVEVYGGAMEALWRIHAGNNKNQINLLIVLIIFSPFLFSCSP